MKSRKRLLSLFLSLAVMFTMSITTAAAIDADNGSAAIIAVETVKQTVKVGDEVTLNVSIANNPGFVAFDFTIQYDKEKLELQGIEKGSFEGSPVGNTATGKVNFIGDVQQECTGDGRLFILKFKVKADCSSGTNVTLETTTFKNASNVMINASVVPGGISETSTGGSSTGGSTTGGSTTGGSTTGGSTTGGSTTGGSTTGGSTTGGSTTGGSTTGGSTTGGGETESIVIDNKTIGVAAASTIYDSENKSLTVTCDQPCVVMIQAADGTLTRLIGTRNSDNTYIFDVSGLPKAAKVVVATKGDANGDGETNAADLALINRAILQGKQIGKFDTMICDVNGDGVVNAADLALMNRQYLRGEQLSWDA